MKTERMADLPSMVLVTALFVPVRNCPVPMMETRSELQPKSPRRRKCYGRGVFWRPASDVAKDERQEGAVTSLGQSREHQSPGHHQQDDDQDEGQGEPTPRPAENRMRVPGASCVPAVLGRRPYPRARRRRSSESVLRTVIDADRIGPPSRSPRE